MSKPEDALPPLLHVNERAILGWVAGRLSDHAGSEGAYRVESKDYTMWIECPGEHRGLPGSA